MYYILFYKTVDKYVERRKPFREEHLKLAMEAYNNGSIVMAGALADPANEAPVANSNYYYHHCFQYYNI